MVAGEHAEVITNGVNLLNGNQHADTTLTMNHDVPGCVSREGFRAVVDDRGHTGRELALEHDRPEVGVVEEVAQLALDVPVVDVHRHGPDLVEGGHGLDPLHAVVGVDADVVAVADPGRLEVVGQAVHLLLEFGEGVPVPLEDQGDTVPHAVDVGLEHVRETIAFPRMLYRLRP